MLPVLIGFGSETGTAQETAEHLHREFLYRDIPVKIAPMNQLSISQIHPDICSAVVFVCSTTGDGEEPTNMKQFWRSLLSRTLHRSTLAGVHFTVLGLGDSSYAKFNYVAKRLFRRLQGLGGTPLHELGLSDDQHPDGSEYQSQLWISDLFEKLPTLLETTFTRNYRLLPPKYPALITSPGEENTHLEKIPNSIEDNNTRIPAGESPDNNASVNSSIPTRERPFVGQLVENRRLTSEEHFQDVRLIGLGVEGSRIQYKPGDVVWIYPQNTEENVMEASRLLKLPLDATLTFTGSKPAHVPQSLSIRDLLTQYLDIAAVPSRYFFELCSNFAKDELELEKFAEFTSLLGRDSLWAYTTRPRRTLLEVLADFHSVRKHLDLTYLLDIIPVTKPRGFSIASAQNQAQGRLEACVAVVRYKTNMKTARVGLCSSWLSTLSLGQPVRFYTTPGSFLFPLDRPIIMVGPGTGCAPFRSLIQDRADTSQPLLLFFGCRSYKHDFFFRSEWESITNLHVVCAFSRDQPNKVYVQHKIIEEGQRVWELLQQGAVFCVAGNSKNMPFQVKDSLVTVARQQGGLSENEALKYIDQLVKNKLYQTETW